MLGYGTETKAYDIERDKIIFSRDVVINKTIENEQDTRTVELDCSSEGDHEVDHTESSSEPPTIRRSSRERIEPDYYGRATIADISEDPTTLEELDQTRLNG